MTRLHTLLLTMLLSATAGCATAPAGTGTAVASTTATATRNDPGVPALAARVREEARHAWVGYRKHAWGHDDLKPVSAGYHDWYAEPLLMTPVDALDTLLMMGLDEEAAEARELIASQLSFDKDIYVKHFEITIRLLGGLLSAYQMTGDERLLRLADELGTRMLPAFDSPTGLPWTDVNLRTGKTRGRVSNPAETGTLLLEYGTLARLTGKPVYYEKAKRALVETYNRRSVVGLVGDGLDVVSGEWTSHDAHIGAGIDSYYEYLWKCWKLFGDRQCLAMWNESLPAINRHLADEVDGALWYGHADMRTGVRARTHYGALDAFLPGLLAYAGDTDRAARLQDSGFRMWQLHGIEPESLDYRRMEVVSAGYPLRPEIVESAWYLHRLDGHQRWREMGARMFQDFVRHCRTETGYAALADVVTKRRADSMESFVMAETFKYFWLLFAPSSALDLDTVVFNTEAHPLRPVAIQERE